MSSIVLLLVFVCASVVRVSANCDKDQDQNNACRVTCDGTVLDISNLLPYPYKIAVDDSSVGQYFTYSPCNGFKCGSIDDTLICLNRDDSNKDSCGTFASSWAITSTNPLTFAILYACQLGQDCTWNSFFTFTQTDDEETKVTYTSQEDGAYQFQVTGKCVGQMNCAEEPSDGHKKSIVGPAGLVLMILSLVALFIYFIAGALVMKYHKGATGKELIPNYLFWSELPFLVKDGCLFVISPCRKRKGYEAL